MEVILDNHGLRIDLTPALDDFSHEVDAQKNYSDGFKRQADVLTLIRESRLGVTTMDSVFFPLVEGKPEPGGTLEKLIALFQI